MFAFLFLNYLVYLLLKLLTTSALAAWAILSFSYYFLIRRVTTYLVFPGCFPIYRRKLEVTFQEQMGKLVLEQIREFSLCLDMFKSGGTDPSMDDYSRTQFLAASASQVRFMVTGYSKQVQSQRLYHKKVLQAENRADKIS